MASVKAGVLTEAEVNGPLNDGSMGGRLFDLQSASTWCLIWFVVAIIMLFVVL